MHALRSKESICCENENSFFGSLHFYLGFEMYDLFFEFNISNAFLSLLFYLFVEGVYQQIQCVSFEMSVSI